MLRQPIRKRIIWGLIAISLLALSLNVTLRGPHRKTGTPKIVQQHRSSKKTAKQVTSKSNIAAAPRSVHPTVKQKEPEDFGILVRLIHAEAGGETLRGQVAVGAVILNRIRSGCFPKTIKANIFKPGEFESVANGYIWSNPTASSYRAARLAIQGWDPTHGALYFYNPAKTYSVWIWNRPIIAKIGRHFFAA